jgi:hypothetical protein
MRRRSKALIVGAAAAAISVLATTQASAGVSGYAKSANGCGQVNFVEYGDNWQVFDLCQDGRGVWLDIDIKKSGSWVNKETIYYTGGYTGIANYKVYNRDYTEGSALRFRVGLGDNGSYVSGTFGSWDYVWA